MRAGPGVFAARAFLHGLLQQAARPTLRVLTGSKVAIAKAIGRSVRTVQRGWSKVNLFSHEHTAGLALKWSTSNQFFALPPALIHRLLALTDRALRLAWQLLPWLSARASRGDEWLSLNARAGGRRLTMQPTRWCRALRELEAAGLVTIKRRGHFATWAKVDCDLNPESYKRQLELQLPPAKGLLPRELRECTIEGQTPFANASKVAITAALRELGDRPTTAAILSAEAPALTHPDIQSPAAWLAAMLRSRRDDCRESWTADTYTPSDGARYYGRVLAEGPSREPPRPVTTCEGCDSADTPLLSMTNGFCSVTDSMLEWARSAMDHEPTEGAQQDHVTRAADHTADILHLEQHLAR